MLKNSLIIKKKLPKILLLVDKPNWAFDLYAKQIANLLKREFLFDIKYVVDKPVLNKEEYDLVYIYFWGEEYHSYYNFESDQIIKLVSSHRWEDEFDRTYPKLTPHKFVRTYLRDASSVACISLRLLDELVSHHPHVYSCRNGIDINMFKDKRQRFGEMKLGWVGNDKDPVKGYTEILLPIVERNRFNFKAATNISHEKMNSFYNEIDILLVASRNEGEPIPLIEGMAAGCFPICTDVGLTQELIKNYENGIIVKDRTQESFEKAIKWCQENLETVRQKGRENAEMMRKNRSWDVFIPYFRKCFNETIERKRQPKFRNDDVAVDTDIDNFRMFCGIFWKYGYTQIHGVTLYGNSNTLYRYNNNASEYLGYDSIANLDNEKIIHLSKNKSFETRKDIINFLNESKDEIALHGLYHTDYSKMSEDEQREHIAKGLSVLDSLFPNKVIRYFIAPFNRTNESLYKVCRELKLQVLAHSGIHMESEIDTLKINESNWYRYHHHRFYPESKFDYYNLSLDKLEEVFIRSQI